MANSYKKTIVLGLDYSEFQGGMNECNSAMKSLDAEFGLMNSQLESGGTQSDKYAAKQEYLTEKINIQQQKVELARKKYDELMSSHADTSKIDKADQALLKERTTLQNLQNEYDESKLASSGFKESCTALIAVLTTLAAAYSKCITSATEYADDLMTMSAQTELSTDALQTFEYAADLIDVDVSTIETSVNKMVSSMSSAQSGSGDAAAAFSELGVSITDASGELRGTEEVFWDTVDALGNIENATKQDELAMEIFGKNAKELTGLIDAGSEGMSNYYDQFEQLGWIMSEDELGNLNDLSDSFAMLGNAFKALGNSMAADIAEPLANFVLAIASIPEPVLKVITILASTVITLVTLAAAINSAQKAGSAITSMLKMLGSGMDSTYAKILLITLAVTALVAAIAVLIGQGSELRETLNTVNSTNGTKSSSTSTAHNASGTDYFEGGMTWVGENGPEIVDVPRGSRIYNNNESTNIAGNTTYNISMNCDLSKMKSISDVVDAVSGLGMSAQCGGY